MALTIAVIPARISTIVLAVSSLLEGFFFFLPIGFSPPFDGLIIPRKCVEVKKKNENSWEIIVFM
jgi:hypothetical protein